jgi:hypothetical protein
MDLADYDDYTLINLLFILYTIFFHKNLFLVPNYGLGRMDLADYDDDYTIDQDFNELSEEMGDDKV